MCAACVPTVFIRPLLASTIFFFADLIFDFMVWVTQMEGGSEYYEEVEGRRQLYHLEWQGNTAAYGTRPYDTHPALHPITHRASPTARDAHHICSTAHIDTLGSTTQTTHNGPISRNARSPCRSFRLISFFFLHFFFYQ